MKDNYKCERIKSPNDITDDGAILLITTMLNDTREEYLHSLMVMYKSQEEYNTLHRKSLAWIKYSEDKALYKKTVDKARRHKLHQKHLDQVLIKYQDKKKKPLKQINAIKTWLRITKLTSKEKKLLETFPKKKPVKNLERKERDRYRYLWEHKTNIEDTERFYMSDDFQDFTLHSGLKGQEVIDGLKKELDVRINNEKKYGVDFSQDELKVVRLIEGKHLNFPQVGELLMITPEKVNLIYGTAKTKMKRAKTRWKNGN